MLGFCLCLGGCRGAVSPRQADSPSGIAISTVPAPPSLPTDDAALLRAQLQSLQDLRAATRSNPADSEAFLQFAREARHAGDYLSALDVLRTASPADPRTGLLLEDERGRCYFGLGLYRQALDLYQRLLARFPTASQSYAGLSHAQHLLWKTSESMHTLEAGARSVPPDDIHGQIRLVAALVSDNALLPALTSAQAAYARAPDDPQVALTLINILDKLRRHAEERPLLDPLLAAHPDNAQAHYFLALLLEDPLDSKRDTKGAEQQYLQALQLDPDNLPAYQRLGALYREQARYREAAAIFTRILQIAPDLAAARQQLAEAYLQMGDTQRGQAQWKIAQKLLSRDREEDHLLIRRDQRSSDPAAWLALGRHYLDAGQYTRALPVLQAAFVLSPTAEQPRRMLAYLYRRMGMAQPALAEKYP